MFKGFPNIRLLLLSELYQSLLAEDEFCSETVSSVHIKDMPQNANLIPTTLLNNIEKAGKIFFRYKRRFIQTVMKSIYMRSTYLTIVCTRAPVYVLCSRQRPFVTE